MHMKLSTGRIWITTALALAAGALAPAAAIAQAPSESDLAIQKTDSADPVTVGQQFTYNIVVSNQGNPANNVLVEDTLPNEVDFVSVNASQGTCELQGSKQVNCTLGTLGDGGSATIAIVVTAERAGTATNTAEVTLADAPDPAAGNNTDTEETVIQEQAGGAPSCAGQQATHVGTAGADTIVGTDKRDVIVGLGGDDTLRGLDGRDLLCGGRGDDTLKGGADADLVKGGADKDRIRGSGGDDTLRGNAGDDDLGGGRGDDALRGGSGSDTCRGGAGKDSRRNCE
jgi:uncharacterized repeat protein (TIGR01451 family)